MKQGFLQLHQAADSPVLKQHIQKDKYSYLVIKKNKTREIF